MKLPALGLAVLALGTLTACSSSSSGSGSGSGARVAIATRDFNNPYWAALRDGAQAEGSALKLDVNVQAGSSETDAAGENDKLSTLVTQGYDCYGAVPVNASNIITPLIPASRANKPIIDLDTQIDTKAAAAANLKITSFIGSDNNNAGQLAGQYMLQLLGGHGKVAILEGIPGEQNGINRETAFRASTAGKLDVVQAQTANYEQDQAQTVTDAILKVHPDITGIFAANDTMGLGAVQSVLNAGKSAQIKVVSIDGIKEALQSVQSGKLAGTVTQYPYAEGQMAVEACQALKLGKTIPNRIVAPIKLITPDNVGQALTSFPKPFFTYADPIAPLLKSK
jgi:ABC-type sugar transport system substrate-binding protein